MAFVVSAAVTAFVFGYVLFLAYIPSASMADTIPEKSLMLGLRLHGAGMPKRGDIIVFAAQGHHLAGGTADAVYFAKRVVGLPGETLEILGGTTWINGVPYDETGYLRETPEQEDYGPYFIPEGCCFVMGDNRNNSLDARYWEDPYVTQKEIVGTILFVF